MGPLRFLDLFAGAGGLGLGLERAGLSLEMAFEVDSDCCATHAAHSGHERVVQGPVQEVSFRRYEGIDVVAGGPPCQPFSSGGKMQGVSDPRNMIPEFARAVIEARPRLALMENVVGLLGGDRVAHLTWLRMLLQEVGYSVFDQVLNAADYGVPQIRKRLIVVAVREGEFAYPAPTHGPRAGTPFYTAGEALRAIDGAPPAEPNASIVTYARNPDLRPSPYDGHLFNGGGRPINLAGLCGTVLASSGGNKTHFVDGLGIVPGYHAHLLRGGEPRKGVLEGARRLSVTESAAFQTFDPNMAFAGSRSSQYAQIGNAVPPRLAVAIGSSVVECLTGSFRPSPRHEAPSQSG